MTQPQPLTVAQVYRACDATAMTFSRSDELPPLTRFVGQERAEQAFEMALSIKDDGYNVFALGRDGLGKRSMILDHLRSREHDGQTLADWVYVNNFDNPRLPRLLRLPIGMGKKLQGDMECLVRRLSSAIPDAFGSEHYYEQSEQIKTEFNETKQHALEELDKEAEQRKLKLIVNEPYGYGFAPLIDGKVSNAEHFRRLAPKHQEEIKQALADMNHQLRLVQRNIAQWEMEAKLKQQQLDQNITRSVVDYWMRDLFEKYKDYSVIQDYLERMATDLVENVAIFLQQEEGRDAVSGGSIGCNIPPRYQVNVMVSHDADATTNVVEEVLPSHSNLIGRIEYVTYMGTVTTDFTLIRPGALHKANGGYLVLDAEKLLEQPFAWQALKRTLRTQKLQIDASERMLSLSGAVTLEPEPMPINIKVILYGDRRVYGLLTNWDPEFKELFRVAADFEEELERSADNEQAYAHLIASIAQHHNIMPLTKKAVARVVEQASRLASHQDKLSLHAAGLADLMKQSAYFAKREGQQLIDRAHIDQALDQQMERAGRAKDWIFESIEKGQTYIDVSGDVVGQINGLSVLQNVDTRFGQPNRITTTCFFGKGQVLDIERYVELGGALHSKGVMILTSFVKQRFAKAFDLPLSANITFEQSYGFIEGDSASLAELCCLLSAMSELPINQAFAVTGSVNQFGEVQPVSAVNEKVEGFFDACQVKGSIEGKGVIIPSTNVCNLMLRQDVVDAVESGVFTVYAVQHVSEALNLLCGLPLTAEGDADSVSKRVDRRIQPLRESLKQEDNNKSGGL